MPGSATDARHRRDYPAPLAAIGAQVAYNNPYLFFPPTPVIDSPHAPFIFYEGAPALGITNGIVNITLAATRTWIGDNGRVVNDQVVVAYLRGNIEAASSLRKALDDALLLAETMTQGTPD